MFKFIQNLVKPKMHEDAFPSSEMKGVMDMWVCTYDQAHVLELKIFECHFVAYGVKMIL
jgi:hypothetical protein